MSASLRPRVTGVVVAGLVATLATVVGDTRAGAAPTVHPCRAQDVSFYFGATFAGLNQRQFVLTALAHDNVTCTLPDRPRITLTAPPDATAPTVTAGGRGGTLTLSPSAPLHTVIAYYNPADDSDIAEVASMTITLPDRSTRVTDFHSPGVVEVSKTVGVSVTAWSTGAGPGAGE